VDYWRANKLDFVLCPGFGSEALNHGVYDKNTLLAAYTFVWNILAMTVCSLPITVVREDEQYYESRWRDEFTKAVQESAVNSRGLPVGVQVVGFPFE
jgi:fatty acid amide hydrolase